jgi:hypothetical protein
MSGTKLTMPEKYSRDSYEELNARINAEHTRFALAAGAVFACETYGPESLDAMEHLDIYGARINPAVTELLLLLAARGNSYRLVLRAVSENDEHEYRKWDNVYCTATNRINDAVSGMFEALEAAKHEIAAREEALTIAAQSMPYLNKYRSK